MTNPIDEAADIDNVDIEEVEKNGVNEALIDEEIPIEEKKDKAAKKNNPALDARHRIEDLIEIKKMRQSLDYINDFESE